MNPAIFQGRDSARQWHAERTCQKSGAAFETTHAGPSIGALIWQLLPFIGLGMVALAFIGKAAR